MSLMEGITSGLSAAGEAVGDFVSSDIGKIVIAGAVAGVAAKALSDNDILSKDVIGGVLGGMAVYGLSKVVMGDNDGNLKAVENAKDEAEKANNVSGNNVDGFGGFVAGIASGTKKAVGAIADGAKTILLGDEQTVEQKAANQNQQNPASSSGGIVGLLKNNPELTKVAGSMLMSSMQQKQAEEAAKKAWEQERYKDATHGINKTFDAGGIKYSPLLQNRQLANQRLNDASNQALSNIRSRIPYPYQ